jgi:hypothetical protein
MSTLVKATGRLVHREELDGGDREAMYTLMATYFEEIHPEAFRQDLEEKNWVILIQDAGGLCGFSTLHVYETDISGSPAVVVYSGDTIVREDAWGTTALFRTWITAVLRLRSGYPIGPCYWLLLTSGYRTYRLLPLFFRTFFPRYDVPLPPIWKARRDELARRRFGNQFDPTEGIVRFSRGSQQLRDGIGAMTPARMRDPHIAFFATQNPGHAFGDELVCVTEIDVGNLTVAGCRMLGMPHLTGCDEARLRPAAPCSPTIA